MHLWTTFNDDQVGVYIDGDEIFNGKITTSISIGLAQQISTQRKFGLHLIEVRVNGVRSKRSPFYLEKETWIGVVFNEGQYKFTVSKKGWRYN